MRSTAFYKTAAVTAIALVSLSACGSSSNSPSSAGSSPANTTGHSSASGPSSPSSSKGMHMSAGEVMLTIKNYMYMGTSTVKPGTKVMVMNDDTVAHTVTSDDGSSFNVTVQAGATATFTAPVKAGTYTYHCDFHANMHGSLVVS